MVFLSEVALVITPCTAHAETAPTPVAKVAAASAQKETNEREVDQAALSAQEQSISKLNGLLKKYRQHAQQAPILLSKLGELQQQRASILFRVAHGTAHRKQKPLDLSKYNQALKQSIGTLDELIGRFPRFAEISRSYFMRGKAYEEIKNKALATQDYLHLVRNYPQADETASAYMALAEFEIDAGNHGKAITYLNEVEKRPESQHFPFALYKLAWAHYNLKSIPTCLRYAEKHIAFYNLREKNAAQNPELKFAANSDAALKEATLQDIAVFFFEGFEEKLPQYALDQALPYFKKIEQGPGLGKMLVRFSKLLRANGHETDLAEWKSTVLASESSRPETLDVVLTVYENQFNKRRFPQLIQSAHDIVALYQQHPKYESFSKAQKLLLDAADALQNQIVKNKEHQEAKKMSATLAAIYDSFAKIVSDKDPRIPKVHYNLAETLFTIQDYTGATENYRWIVERTPYSSWRKKETAPGSALDVSLKAIASRYEVLRQKGLIPKDLKALRFADNEDSDLEPMLAEWDRWIDKHLSYTPQGVDHFLFEANRALYAQKHILASLKRMRSFASSYPSSQHAVAAASLVIDTAIKSEDWEKTHDDARKFLKIKEWKDTEFSKHLFRIAADASYKQIETLHRAKEYKKALASVDDFLEDYKASPRLADTLTLAGNAALALQDKKRANTYFTKLINEVPDSENLGAALLSRASLEEERYELGSAAQDYRTYLSIPPKRLKIEEGQANLLRKKTLMLTWLAGDERELKAALQNPILCTESLRSDCERFSILSAIAAVTSNVGELDEETTSKAFSRARKEDGESRLLWATLALAGSKRLAFRDRLLATRFVAGNWDDADPLVKFFLMPKISAWLPKAFQLNRIAMPEVGPLRANEKYITHRVDVIKEFENAATKVVKLPWSRIRASVLNEVAGVYLDFARGLAGLPAPKDLSSSDLASYEETVRKLTLPFEEKGQDMRLKSFEIASKFSIEDDVFNSIAEPFFTENPSQAKALKPAQAPAQPPAIDLALLTTLDPAGPWKAFSKGKYQDDSEDATIRLESLWAKALSSRNAQLMAYLIQEGQQKKLLPTGVLESVRAVALATAGARGEALSELDQVRKQAEPSAQVAALIVLIQYSHKNYAKAQTEKYLSEVPHENLSRDQASVVASASAYALPQQPATAAKAPTETQRKPAATTKAKK